LVKSRLLYNFYKITYNNAKYVIANKFRILIFFITVQHRLSCNKVTFIKGLAIKMHTFFRELYYLFT
jgi:hypothetical protein